jgi:hypothetical protein
MVLLLRTIPITLLRLQPKDSIKNTMKKMMLIGVFIGVSDCGRPATLADADQA